MPDARRRPPLGVSRRQRRATKLRCHTDNQTIAYVAQRPPANVWPDEHGTRHVMQPLSHALRVKNGQLQLGARWIYVPTALGLRYTDVACPGCRRTGRVDLYDLERAVAEAKRRGLNFVKGRWVDHAEIVVVGNLVERGTLLAVERTSETVAEAEPPGAIAQELSASR